MKRRILSLTFVSTVALFTLGCGGSSKSPSANEVTIKFKKSGTYDLRQYLMIPEAKTNNYVNKSYSNSKGKKEYKNTPDSETYPYVTMQYNGNIVKEFREKSLDTTYKILADRINATDAEDNATDDIARFADKGDYILKRVTKSAQKNYESLWKVNAHFASKKVTNKVYNDVLEIISTYKDESTAIVSKNNVTSVDKGENKVYLAKGIGLILEIDEDCSETKIDNTSVKKECTKDIEEITTIN